MGEYPVTVVNYPAKRLVGVKVLTTMQKAMHDCPALWQAFGPRSDDLKAAGCDCKGAYGVSVMVNAENFEYWAAVEIGPSASVPAGMGCVDIPAGQYAKCAAPNLEKLGEAYMHIYTAWLKGQREYALNEQAPSFELYPANWDVQDALEIFVPVKKA